MKRRRPLTYNDRMHPDNPYKSSALDFVALAQRDPAIKALMKKDGKTYDFARPGARYALTATLLRHDFNLQWEMPQNRLVPTVPNRINYLLWMGDLVAAQRQGQRQHVTSESPDPAHEDPVRGIDIGTGASCIYPLLGQRMRGWRFVATDIDPESVASARANVARNGMQDAIDVRLVDENVVLAGALTDADEEPFDFCMCNPPFFAHSSDKATSHTPADFMGHPRELVTTGGEVAFVSRIIADSVGMGPRVRVYSSMLGKKQSLKEIKRVLRAHGIDKWKTRQLFQGTTVRWAIAWFASDIPPKMAAAPAQAATRRTVPPGPSPFTGNAGLALLAVSLNNRIMLLVIYASSHPFHA